MKLSKLEPPADIYQLMIEIQWFMSEAMKAKLNNNAQEYHSIKHQIKSREKKLTKLLISHDDLLRQLLG